MTDLTLEAQAKAVRSVMRFGLSASDRKHLEEVERTLQRLVALRSSILESGNLDKAYDLDSNERISAEIGMLLGIQMQQP